ncbi:MAG: hypothetical protein Q8P68_02590 [Candidatus Peregrinibacteria bacterium]|nr:hypothetical protein [Candidatus Peregrinibacteria bacterium]MDZ4245215.1 hypothetical protein [Candidatus Gracilibacteria bacterium]
MRNLYKFIEWKNWHFFLLFFLLGLTAYINISAGDFIWDEKTLIIGNEHVHSLKYFFNWFTESPTYAEGVETSNMYRPLATMAYAVIYSVAGLNTIPYHLVNIFLHIGNAFLTFVFLQRLGFMRIGSLLAGIVFLLHPIQTESVSYIAGLPDVLAPFFMLLGLNIFANNKELTARRITYITILMLCGILSKEIGIIFVPLTLLIVLFKKEDYLKKRKPETIKTLLILSGVTIAYLIFRITALNTTGTFSLIGVENLYTENILYRIYTFFAAGIEYIKMIIYPVHLFFEKPFEAYIYMAPKVLAGMSVALIGLIFSINSYRKDRHIFFIYFWFAITIALVSGVAFPSNALYKEHWLYMPLIGIVMLIPCVLEKIRGGTTQKIFIGVICIMSILSIIKTIDRNSQWRDAKTFFENEISYNPTSSRLYNELGMYYYERENWQSAKTNFEKGILLNKIRLMPELGYNLGNTYLAMGDQASAAQMYRLVLESDPTYLKAHIAMYNLAKSSDNKEMEALFLKNINRLK